MTSVEDLRGKGKDAIPFDQVPVDCARDYSCEDADVTLQLRELFEPQLEALQLAPLFRDIELPLVDVLAEMEWNGITIDVAWFRSLKARFERERERVEQEIYAAAGEEFNIDSNPQLRAILFEKLQLPVRKKTATGPSTDASVLQELADEGHALPVLLMEYRELAKLESTYLDALPQLRASGRRPRAHVVQPNRRGTGRLSSSDPNLQNIPIRRELGETFAAGSFRAAGGCCSRPTTRRSSCGLLAHLSGDPAFVEAFRAGGDIHRQTAAIIFDVPVDEVTRKCARRRRRSTSRRSTARVRTRCRGSSRSSTPRRRHSSRRYFERFSRVREFLDSMIEHARERGYVETIFKRRRYIPELRDRNFNIRAFGERTAQNSPIQGSAADLIKVAMINIHDALIDEQHSRAGCCSRCTTSSCSRCPPDELDALRRLGRSTRWSTPPSSTVPLVVDVGTGENWSRRRRTDSVTSSPSARRSLRGFSRNSTDV